MSNNLTILWLDDVRNPYKYLDKKNNSNTFSRNKNFYDSLKKQYNINFIWVKNIEQFSDYIVKHGLPEMISFDHDLGAGLPKGLDCAKWLVNYCRKTKQTLPKCFVHSANPNGQREIKNILKINNGNVIMENKIYITESDITKMVQCVLKRLNEDAYIGDINTKKKTANISYSKGSSNYKKKISGDFLNTDKMDALDSSTYIVPLKGGIVSYNITDINGTEVMHYFKNYFDRTSTTISVKDKSTGSKEDYKLKMDENEFNQFLNTFFQKVNRVIQYKIKEFGNPQLEKVSIYPVPSSSNFNEKMAEEMQKFNFSNIKGGTQVINQAMFKKDLKNIAVDTDFINKNKDYYNSPLYADEPNGQTHMNSVNTTFNKFKTMSEYIDKYVEYINRLIKRIMTSIYTNKSITKKKGNDKQFSDTLGKNLWPLYKQLADAYDQIIEKSKYLDDFTKKTKIIYRDDQIKPLKYAKGPSNEANTELVWNLVKPYIRGLKTTSGKPIKKIPIRPIENRFSIKSLTNDIRLGLKNYFSKDEDVVKTELEKIKNTVFVIFDDNISGGATLSDICLQAKNLGIQYIIPITFGKMRESYNKSATVTVTRPENGFDFS